MDSLSEPVRRPKNKKWLKFCHAVAGGVQPSQAYVRHVSRPPRHRTAYEAASRISRHFCAYIATLRERLAKRAEEADVMSKIEVQQYLSRAARTPLNEITADSDLCQERTIDKDGAVKLKSVGKLEAIAQLCKISGFDSVQQINVTHTLVESPALRLIRELRDATKTQPNNPHRLTLNQGRLKAGIEDESMFEQAGTGTSKVHECIQAEEVPIPAPSAAQIKPWAISESAQDQD